MSKPDELERISMKATRTHWLLIACLHLTSMAPAMSQSDFKITELPKGKSVTLPRPATTIIPISEAATLTSTDKSQTIKFTVISSSGQSSPPIKLTIYDKHSETPRQLILKANSPTIYSFKGLGSIRIKTAPYLQSQNEGSMRVESNRPMGIRRN